MKAVVIKAKEKGGSSIPVLELGGIHLKDGEQVLVDSRIAKRVASVYRGKLELGEEKEVERLRNGHYEKLSALAAEPVKPAKVKKETKVEEKAESPLEEVSKDRSMGSFLGKKKRRSKKAKKED